MNWVGPWSAFLSYAVDDVVEIGGSSYIALVTTAVGSQPPNGQWALLAERGATGAQGPQGAVGQVGPTGAVGPQGAAGVAGPQGLPGSEGVIGPQGAVGPTGPVGPQGAVGAVGPQGVKGMSWAGPWSAFLSYSADEVVELDGNSYIALVATAVGSQPPNGQWGTLAQRGADGPPGPQGRQGDQGAQGGPGAQGPAGAAGPPGLSAVVTQLPPGDVHCQYGGVEVTAANGSAYACSGAPGDANGPTPGVCSGTATNLMVDPLNCGSCGNRCASRTCSSGACAKLVFGTSGKWNGADLGGVTGADAKCQATAEAAGLAGTYRAWLSQSGWPSVPSRLNHPSVPLVLTNGAILVDSWSQFAYPSSLKLMPLLDESGEGVPWEPTQVYSGGGNHQFWVGTTSYFALYGGVPDCNGWTTTSGWGAAGNWQNGCSNLSAGSCPFANLAVSNIVNCGASLHLACFEQ